MTEFEIVTSVMNLVTSHEGVTNTSLSPDQVAEEIDTLRGRMAFEMDKVGLFRRPFIGFTQTIPSLTILKRANNSRYVNIPKLMTKRDGTPAFEYIGGKDGISPYRVITGDQIKNAKYDQFIGTLPTVGYTEGLLDFYNVVPSFIKVVGVFEDPSSLEEIDGVWDIEVNDYPMPIGMIDELIGKTVNSYIRSMYTVPITPNTQSDKNTGQQNARR